MRPRRAWSCISDGPAGCAPLMASDDSRKSAGIRPLQIHSVIRYTFAMNSSRALRHLRTLSCSCLIAGGLAGAALPATDQELVQRVEAALQSDPYFYEAHVSVSADNGSVVLSGMVFSDWDLNDALRIARRAAGGARVIDNLTIETGGRR
jgi:hypothetical protein